MDLNRLRLGETVAAAAALVLFLAMFLPWYGVHLGAGGGLLPGVSVTASAWRAFAYTDLLLLLTIVVAVGAAVLTATQQDLELPVARGVLVAGLAGICTLLVLYRIINQPGPDDLIDVHFGAYVGLVLVAAVAVGGFMMMQEDEGTRAPSAGAGTAAAPGPPPTGTGTAPPPAAPPTPPPAAPSPPPTEPPPPAASS